MPHFPVHPGKEKEQEGSGGETECARRNGKGSGQGTQAQHKYAHPQHPTAHAFYCPSSTTPTISSDTAHPLPDDTERNGHARLDGCYLRM